MNASATIRASYIRQARMSYAPPSPRPLSIPETTSDLQPRPALTEKLEDFKPVHHLEHREKCNTERFASIDLFDVEKLAGSGHASIEHRYFNSGASFMDIDDNADSVPRRFRKMFTTFPYRDPIWLVAVVFAIGSIDLVINAFFDLIPRINPSTTLEAEGTVETVETVAVPTTVLIGAILFFAASIFDTFGALNADRGTLTNSKVDGGKVTYRPALLGTPDFKWFPSGTKLFDLTMNDLAFQAGLLVLFGGIIFMFAGVVDFPGIIPEDTPFFGFIVFWPQVIHGALFLVANGLLAFSEQERWYIPKINDADWQGAFLNSVGGFGFMMAGLFLLEGEELKAAVAAMVGSWAFLIGSLIRWYVVMEFW